jgi:predicted amidophosphoribosyltransferase
MKSIYCSECGTKNSADSKFCGNCGAKILPLEIEKRICPSCSYVAGEDEKFCPECGSAIDSKHTEVRDSNSSIVPSEKKSRVSSKKKRALITKKGKKGSIFKTIGKVLLVFVLSLFVASLVISYLDDDWDENKDLDYSSTGSWVHYDTKVINGCAFYQHKCYKVVDCENSGGKLKVSVQSTCQEGPEATVSGRYNLPPKRIIPGNKYTFETSIKSLNVRGLMHIWAGIYDNISFEKDNISFGKRSYEEIIVTSDTPSRGEINLPEDLDKDATLMICAGAGIGNSSIRVNSFYLYKWEE